MLLIDLHGRLIWPIWTSFCGNIGKAQTLKQLKQNICDEINDSWLMQLQALKMCTFIWYGMPYRWTSCNVKSLPMKEQNCAHLRNKSTPKKALFSKSFTIPYKQQNQQLLPSKFNSELCWAARLSSH